MKGAHARFVTYAEHTVKCKDSTITEWASTTFYRWKKDEEQKYEKSPDKDELLPQRAHPIRHERQVHGLLQLGNAIDNSFLSTINKILIDKLSIRSFCY